LNMAARATKIRARAARAMPEEPRPSPAGANYGGARRLAVGFQKVVHSDRMSPTLSDSWGPNGHAQECAFDA
jgi:hypothetical protein